MTMTWWELTSQMEQPDGSYRLETQYIHAEEQPCEEAEQRTRPPLAGEVWNGSDWELPLAEVKSRAWEAVKALRQSYHYGSASTPFGDVQCDPEAKANVTGLALMATIAKNSGATYSEPFTLADNSVVVLDADQMIAMSLAVGEHVSAVFSRARDLRDQIEAAASAADVAAIDIETGWLP